MRVFFQMLLGSALCLCAVCPAWAQAEFTYRQQAYVKASNTGAGDLFGVGVAISGDTMVAGALSESSVSSDDPSEDSRTESGAAYVYVRESGHWRQQAMLKPPG